ncbi:TetR/AcrR family transcriptional regulator [Aeromicrobium phragmitis]|uniref:TetR/AcrR family transcriptional regulator n=1 Tax=Aeromicrobium phragmitis TaxID=2478914 RepID=UPI001AA05F9C|nr:TetR/AcrR family transcriptional regulator [Aeromicrobium phragmitis]
MREFASRQTDGRARRSERTRAAIVDAHVRLLRGGELRPSAKQIAEEAGVSVRTLWGTFGDMESLFAETVDYWFASDDALAEPIDIDQSLDERIAQFCKGRERRLLNIAPAARAALLLEPVSPTLQSSREGHIDRVRQEIARVFAVEIDRSDDPDTLLDALAVATSWNAWSLLHDDHGREAAACRAAMELTLRALLTPTAE